jgi:hypothetical protein
MERHEELTQHRQVLPRAVQGRWNTEALPPEVREEVEIKGSVR